MALGLKSKGVEVTARGVELKVPSAGMPSAAASSADGCPPRASPPVTAVGNAAAAVRDSPSQHEDEKGKSLTAAASAVHENPDLAQYMPPNWHKGVAHCRDAYRSKFGEELTGHFDTAVEAALAYARRAQTAAAAAPAAAAVAAASPRAEPPAPLCSRRSEWLHPMRRRSSSRASRRRWYASPTRKPPKAAA